MPGGLGRRARRRAIAPATAAEPARAVRLRASPLVLPVVAAPVVEALAARRVLGGLPVSRLIPHDKTVENLLLLAATETATEAGMDALIGGLKEALQ